jgi:hypothetical protein
VCNTTFNNISVISRTALLVEKTRVHRENHRLITDKLYHGGVHVHRILIFCKYSQNDRWLDLDIFFVLAA